MTRAECIAFLQELEQRFDTGSLVIDGVCAWPAIRVTIGGQILGAELPAAIPQGYTRRTKMGQLGRFFSGCIQFASWSVRLPRTDLLFHSLQRGRTEVAGAHYDRFTDPLLRAADREALTTMVIDRRQDGWPALHMAVPARRFDATAAIEAMALVHWRRPVPSPASVPGLTALLNRVKERIPGFNVHLLMDQLHSMRFYLRFHRRLLRLTRPKCVFVVCWYTMENMAIAQACQEAGVRCVDLQHGVQGPAHIAYGNWTAIAGDGYGLMPKVFWCWDEGQAAHINSWAAGTMHRALALGDAWSEMALTLDARTPWKTDGRKRILFTAQPVKEILPPALIQAIRATAHEAQWMIRTHPGRPGMAAAIKSALATAGLLDAVIIDDARASLLVRVLAESHLHVTAFSSVILEAAAAGVPSAAMHPYAAELFPDQLATGELIMALHADQLIDMVRAAMPTTKQRKASSSIAERLRMAIGA